MKLDYSTQKKILVGAALAILGAIAAYFALFKLAPLVVPFLLAVVFAFMINPLVDFFDSKIKINRKISSAFIILLVFAVLGTICYFVSTQLYYSVKGILTEIVGNIFEYDGSVSGLAILSEKLSTIFNTEINLVEMLKTTIVPAAQKLLNSATNFAARLPHLFVASVVFILATYFMVSDRERIFEFLNINMSEKAGMVAEKIKVISKTSVLQYVKAQLVILCITFTELIIGFTIIKFANIIDLNYVVLIALGVAVLDALPIFGTGTVLIPWSLYNLVTGDYKAAAAVIILYGICLMVRQLIEPKIVSKSLGLHPLLTLLLMYIGLKTAGIVGMILFPILGLFAIQIYKLYRELKNEL